MELIEIRELTLKYSGEFGLNHVDRLLKLIEIIGEHNTSGDCSSVESTLLRDADYLDFLGFIGIVRDIVRRPHDVKKAMEMIKKRIPYFDFLLLPKSIEIGKERLAEINYFLERMELEAFGLY